ncbi:endoglucanase 16 [Impatiens glandulifera]|uniref:endoglucanase 16 n=1 Tax=Impatiens glandulifera TaxID=253017 RepID=UPI001FB17C43|nr:endoglucanase 16 [Impatiens glandulifera]
MIILISCLIIDVEGNFNYKDALTKSLIFLEAQRSGKLPPNHRPSWRGDSALDDGKLAHADLAGGYYDAGDNVKYGLPLAFTVTTLAWGVYAYEAQFKSAGELNNALDAIRWGTDYLLKASSKRNRLFVQVGDPDKDHQCWVGPENMQTPRTVLQIDESHPGTEIAGETAAALAAASVVFKRIDRAYSHSLLNKAKLVFEFANSKKGTYDGECPFYCSYSGYNDELLWAATWLYIATKKAPYLQYVQEDSLTAQVQEFSWDLKYAGAQILLAKVILLSFYQGEKSLDSFKDQADSYICSVHPDSPYHQVFMTAGGLIHLRDGANLQYVTGTAFLFSVYSDVLAQHNQKVTCGATTFNSASVMAFAKKQMDYILGDNPLKRSYMVGFGENPPLQAHHRGASVPKMSTQEVVNCGMSFTKWYNVDGPNPNELTGAIVGGPDKNDQFNDKRSDSSMTEPTTYTNTLAIGVLAKLAGS